MFIVTRHPSGVRLEIVGINEGNRGRSCEQHRCCGRIVTLDMVLRLRKVQIINGKGVCVCVLHCICASIALTVYFLDITRLKR